MRYNTKHSAVPPTNSGFAAHFPGGEHNNPQGQQFTRPPFAKDEEARTKLIQFPVDLRDFLMDEEKGPPKHLDSSSSHLNSIVEEENDWNWIHLRRISTRL